ncbi:acyl carrier protein [Rariglobus hedericola]|nr:acyl carrier protein [Rariglobus hedericola]
MNASLAHANSAEFSAALRDFINVELPKLNPRITTSPGVDAATPLFETGIIDSLGILHLIAWVERATGHEIPIGKVVMKHFQTITAITETFYSTDSCHENCHRCPHCKRRADSHEH